jgi:hypothetical protein
MINQTAMHRMLRGLLLGKALAVTDRACLVA